MGERIKITTKKPFSTEENSAPYKHKIGFRSQSSHVDRILFLQRTIGNQTVQRLIKSGTLQAKLKIGQPGDKYEQEADRVADAVMRMPEPQAASGDATHIQRVSPTYEEEELRRQPIEEEEEELQRQPIEEEEEELQAKANSGHISYFNPDLESQIQSLKGGGQPLSENYRRFFEPRFGRDFSQVRIHTDMKAAESAQAVNARAYTVGLDVIFGAGQFAPGTTGKRLLAHELTHVVQQQGMPSGRLLQRDRDRFDETVLQEYLDGLTATGDIENNLNSDNKARAVVNAWRLGGSQYVLDAERKTLLIRQMQRRVTGNKDEQAILEILERSYNPELSIIFRSISADDLKSDFHGTERERLQDFYARRFEGGMHAVLSGTIAPLGYPVPLGLNIEEAAGEVSDISSILAIGMELPSAQTSWNVPCVLGILCSQDEAVVSQLSTLQVNQINRIDVTHWDFRSGVWTSSTVHPSGLRDPGVIGVLSQRHDGTPRDCDDAAQTLIHEVRHENQPQDWLRYDREKDAYTYDVGWAISRGIPNRQNLRTTNSGVEIPDTAAIREHVCNLYGCPTTAGAPGETMVGHEPATTSTPAITLVRNPDDNPNDRPRRRMSELNDRYNDLSTLVQTGVQPIPPDKWDCPG